MTENITESLAARIDQLGNTTPGIFISVPAARRIAAALVAEGWSKEAGILRAEIRAVLLDFGQLGEPGRLNQTTALEALERIDSLLGDSRDGS